MDASYSESAIATGIYYGSVSIEKKTNREVLKMGVTIFFIYCTARKYKNIPCAQKDRLLDFIYFFILFSFIPPPPFCLNGQQSFLTPLLAFDEICTHTIGTIFRWRFFPTSTKEVRDFNILR